LFCLFIVALLGFQINGSSFEASLTTSDSCGKSVKKEVKNEPMSSDSEDDIPLSSRLKEAVAKKRCKPEDDDDDYESSPTFLTYNFNKKKKKEEDGSKKTKKEEKTGRRKKAEPEEDVWKWFDFLSSFFIYALFFQSLDAWKVFDNYRWEEEKKPEGIKWKSLSHKGPVFAAPYVPLPDHVKFKYDGKELKLSEPAEEVAGFYARMLDHEYTSKDVFNNNFFKDWRKTMSSQEREIITDLKKCDFREIHAYYIEMSEKRKAMSKEEKDKIKQQKELEMKEYGFAYIDGHKQKIGNFRIEPPGLYRGRGGHPKMGRLKQRVQPEDVIINCSKDSEIPVPPPGHHWKEIRHDNTVTWLCSWTENVLGQNKYIMLNPSSKIKGEKDYEKFETARRLKSRIDDIRAVYTADFKSREMRIRQRAVALYFIDKLALRAGNEKDVDEVADTVGCCSLRCEHIKLKLFDHTSLKKLFVVLEFDFLGKDSIRYYNRVPVEKRVFKNLMLFMENKEPGDDLFDRLDTTTLNQHLQSLMPGLTVKVFRTYNASITLQDQLEKLTQGMYFHLLSYNRANRQVAILCNHQRAIPKSHEKSMENLKLKIKAKKKELAEQDYETARGDHAKQKAKKKVERLKEQLRRLKIQRTDKDENKQIALGTSKLNYLDPRISVAWCKKFNVPIEKIFNRTQREKFRWAIDMADEDYVF
uniref:DNA topoisomerase I n=1 Tax=Syphacia muris TaxID=451379 RepID=A0A0N5API8_9BILA